VAAWAKASIAGWATLDDDPSAGNSGLCRDGNECTLLARPRYAARA
jgi:hypothetical protein